jgi:putative endopeptidase
MTKTEKRDPVACYNKMTIKEMQTTLCEGKFNFETYFKHNGKEAELIGDLNVAHKQPIKHAANLIASVDPDVLENYLRWHVVSDFASYLPQAFVQEDFEFFQKTLAGTKELKPRWKRAMAWTESALGEALGKIYCGKYFT